jgi:hypothetical protein
MVAVRYSTFEAKVENIPVQRNSPLITFAFRKVYQFQIRIKTVDLLLSCLTESFELSG